MKVLGIDPGIEITGFAVIETNGATQVLLHCGVIRTSKELTTSERLCIIQEDLQSILSQHTEIECVGVEELFFSKNAKTAFVVGQARGVILLTLEQAKIPLVEVKPVEVKSAIVGTGNAGKKEVQRMVQLLFHLDAPPQPDDAADAAAIALTAAARYSLQK